MISENVKFYLLSGLIHTGGEILPTALADFSDTPEDEETTTDVSGMILIFPIYKSYKKKQQYKKLADICHTVILKKFLSSIIA